MTVLSIAECRTVLEAHGFQLFGWGGTYRITRDVPPYGKGCPAGKGFHRDWCGFNASDVSLSWVRKLAAALVLADAGQVTSGDCADAWAAHRKAELRSGGASRVAQLTYQVLLECWQIWHPISETVAAIDRGRQPLATA